MVGMKVVRAARRDARDGSVIGRPVLLVTVTAAFLAASGAAYQSIVAAQDRRLYPLPERRTGTE